MEIAGVQMEPLPTQTLFGLLRMYDVAIADLRATRDSSVGAFVDRLVTHRDEVLTALERDDSAASGRQAAL